MQNKIVCTVTLILCIFLKVNVAHAQDCGSNHSDDGDGSYVSSTSDDKCPTSNFTVLLSSIGGQDSSAYRANQPLQSQHLFYAELFYVVDTDHTALGYSVDPTKTEPSVLVRRLNEGSWS